MITLGVLFWSLAGLWVWLHIVNFAARKAWLIIAGTAFGGPAVWLIMLFVSLYHVRNPGSDIPPEPKPERQWFRPQGTSRN
jgi:hypothetical protein